MNNYKIPKAEIELLTKAIQKIVATEVLEQSIIDKLPVIDKGDYLVIHDTGAHGFAMGYSYNGKLKSAELLLQPDGNVKMIRRAETPADYFATFDCFDYKFEK